MLTVVDDARVAAWDGHAAWSESLNEMFAQVAGVRECGGARHGRAFLLDLLARVPDPGKGRGRRHPLAGLLAIGIAAVIAGPGSFAAVGQWAADAGPEALVVLGAARGPA